MKLSIITPVYNRADCILRCLASVASQNGCGSVIEHVVVDDGSTDNTAGLVRDFAAKHPHVRTVFFDRNRGTNAARNAAVRHASGDYCVILDSDDYFTPDACAVILKAIESTHDARYFMFTRDDRTEEFDRLYGAGTVVRYSYRDVLNGKVTGDYIHVIPRSMLEKYPFDEDLKIYESLIIQQIYREVGEMVFENKTIVIAERNRSDSVTWNTLRTNEKAISRKLQAAVKELELFGDDYLCAGNREYVDGLYFNIVDNAVLTGDYGLAKKYIPSLTGWRKSLMNMIVIGRLGPIYKNCLNKYLNFKYRSYGIGTKK